MKDNWIKANSAIMAVNPYKYAQINKQAFLNKYGEAGERFIKEVEHDATEKTNKRWREKLEEYIDKLDKWTPPSQFGFASGSMTKKFIKDDLSDLLEDKK